jgi:hypothetical protein
VVLFGTHNRMHAVLFGTHNWPQRRCSALAHRPVASLEWNGIHAVLFGKLNRTHAVLFGTPQQDSWDSVCLATVDGIPFH